MAQIGFSNYDTVEVTPQPTTAELVASLTPVQKGAVLNGFANKILPQRLKKTIFIPVSVISHLYRRIDAIEEFCRTLLRQEMVDTETVVDPKTGEITTPAKYVKLPTTLTGLKKAVDGGFSEEFSAAQSGAIVDKMIAYSKADGKGDAAYYLSKVTK